MKFKKVVQVVLVLSATIYFGCTPKEAEQSESARYVKVAKVTGSESIEKLVFNGKVKEKSLTYLSFRVGGPLEQLNVKTGDYVNAGDIIAVIDKRDYKLQVQSTKVQFQQVKGEYGRYKELYEKNKIPINTYEKIESGYLMAKTAYDNAVNQLNDTELRAPVSGYIHEKFIENFQTVGPGEPIISIIDVSQLEVVISVAENQLIGIKNCRNNYLTVKNAEVFNVPVSLLSVNEKTGIDGLYEVRFIFNNKGNMNIHPGMTAEVVMICNDQNIYAGIPVEAVFYNDNSTYVWIYDSSTKKIQKRKIKIESLQSGGTMKVISGLETGELIVAAGVHSLSDNQRVQPIEGKSETNIGGLL